MEENKIWIECNCGCEALRLEYDKGINDELFISIYSQIGRKNNKISIIHRLKLIWYIIWTGDCWKDQTILNCDERNKLLNFLKNL